MSGCNLDDCKLTDDVQAIHDSTLRMEMGQQALMDKFDEYMTTNDEQHKTFFDRTRWAVTWKALGLTVAGFIAAIGTIIIEKATSIITWLARRGSKNSLHCSRLAIDLNLFKDGKYLSSSDDHRELGRFWEMLHPQNRSGIRYRDGNHYEMVPKPWRGAFYKPL
jgi:hypothetical protein